MKSRSLLTAAMAAVACMACADEFATWTSVKGSVIEARFVKEQYGTVHLQTADGSIKQIKLSNLSRQDRRRVAELTDPFAAKKAAEARAEAEQSKASDELHALFGDTLRNNREKAVSADALAGKTVGIYFSAHWCGPCRAFTPQLVSFHEEMTRKGKPFEIVFVSSDRNSGAMYGYMEEMNMPWLAVDFDSKEKESLKKLYKVKGIPTLVIIDAEGHLITKNGRGDITQHGNSAFSRWK
jgi:thiol-disulfide isomerase/thioredoxin